MKAFKVSAHAYYIIDGRTIGKSTSWRLQAMDETGATSIIKTPEEEARWFIGTIWKTEEITKQKP